MFNVACSTNSPCLPDSPPASPFPWPAQVHCDAHGRPLYPQHAQRAEERIAAAMAARLGERPSGGTLGGTGAVAAAAAAAANGNSFDGGSGGPDLRAAGSGSSPVAPLAAHPSPFDNQAVEPYLNLGPYMSLAPASVRLATPAAHVHSLLLGLSLRRVMCGPDGGASSQLGPALHQPSAVDTRSPPWLGRVLCLYRFICAPAQACVLCG